ncbi:putative Flavoprotein-like superfamily [Septoria linicola]|nr:putative Flavoprotein-like superfamily [Septoria linicola]
MDRVLELPAEVLQLWHSHRVEVLLSAGVLLAIVRLAAHWRSKQVKVLLTPLLGTPVSEKQFPLSEHKEPLAQSREEAAAIEPAKTTGPKRVKGVRNGKRKDSPSRTIDQIQPYVFYYSLGGSTRAYAEKLASNIESNDQVLSAIVHDLTEIDYDDFFIYAPKQERSGTAAFYYILLPSYNIDTELSNFLSHLEETHHDFRIDDQSLSSLAGYSVFGFGDRQEWPTEEEGYCSQAVEVDRWMAKLTGKKRAFPLGTGDVKGDDAELRLEEWRRGVHSIVQDLSQGQGLGEGAVGSGDPAESGDEASEDEEDGETLFPTQRKSTKRTTTDDLEDIKAPIPVDFTTTSSKKAVVPAAPKAMVPKESPTYSSLTKQGYTIVGSHSGVKICRWTKSALRGRGSCYKFSFYGIASHQCMEATPSLACANKCVFCWRHGTNPVGTSWRWTVDPPDQIFDGMTAGHYQKIKQLRGVPGVRAERFAEGMRIRHCALSLVGEPIFYPHINELLGMLHAQHISSFLVCNAQHPDQLRSLGPVTQLYVSIDASNKEQLRKIDRPLHRDYWERFTQCMDILREKRFTHRTVFRLTLVKGFNIDEEAQGYADLVERARPGFVEVKGVTYCGTSTSKGAGLSMENVPFYEEVQAFVLALEAELKKRGLEYGIGAEHAHSCCILLADKTRFWKPLQAGQEQRTKYEGEGRYHTLIDYPAFFKCVESGKAFGPEDYTGGETAQWALWGNGGFDPRDERVDRKGRPKDVPEIKRVVEI